MSLKKAAQATEVVDVPNEIKASLFKYNRDGKEAVRGQITLGPIVIDAINVYPNTFTNNEGVEKEYLEIEFPARPSENLNPNTGKPYVNRIITPTKEAKEELYKVIRQRARLALGQELKDGEELITKWKYAGQKFTIASDRIATGVKVNDDYLNEKEDAYWVIVGDFEIAGIRVSGVFLRVKKPQVDENGNLVERDSEYDNYYSRFPNRKHERKGKDPVYFDYLRPINKEVRAEINRTMVDIAIEAIQKKL